MKLALDRPIHEFTDDGLKTWISRITHIHPDSLLSTMSFGSAIEGVLLLSHGNRVIPFLTNYPTFICVTVSRNNRSPAGSMFGSSKSLCYCAATHFHTLDCR